MMISGSLLSLGLVGALAGGAAPVAPSVRPAAAGHAVIRITRPSCPPPAASAADGHDIVYRLRVTVR